MSDAPNSAMPASPSRAAGLAVLRATFPDYSFRLIRWDSHKPHYEALSKSGGDPWCLNSDDICEIWRGLKAAAV